MLRKVVRNRATVINRRRLVAQVRWDGRECSPGEGNISVVNQ